MCYVWYFALWAYFSFGQYIKERLCVSELGHHWFRHNGLSPVRCQAITWTIVDSLSIRPPGNRFQWNLNQRFKYFHSRKSIWKCRLQIVGYFVSTSTCWVAPYLVAISKHESGQLAQPQFACTSLPACGIRTINLMCFSPETQLAFKFLMNRDFSGSDYVIL